MEDRTRIMLGDQEIVKRYIGDRLVWSGGGEIFINNRTIWFFRL